jgi:hypothetical protein
MQGFEDVNKQAKLIDQNEAVILSAKPLDFPGYTSIFIKQWPDEIPWIGGWLFIYAPKRFVGDKKVLPGHADQN